MRIICTVSEFADIVRGCDNARRLGHCRGDACPLFDVCGWGEGKIEQFITAADVVDEMPVADAAPVVRCKECKHRGHDACPMSFEYDEYESREIDNTVDDGFCHKGAKMDAKEGGA
mgnify:CR=1 FL=1